MPERDFRHKSIKDREIYVVAISVVNNQLLRVGNTGLSGALDNPVLIARARQPGPREGNRPKLTGLITVPHFLVTLVL